MINIVVPMAGSSIFFDNPEFRYPKPLIEMGNKTMVEHVVQYLEKIQGEKRYIFIINDDEVRKFHLDNVIKLVAGSNTIIIKQTGPTKGALCSVLLGIDYINNDLPLIISNCDQVINADLNVAIRKFNDKNADAGLVCFESVHPKWSYALTSNDSEEVVEVAEKRPISNNSIAGFYYYKNGIEFVEAAKKTIVKDANIEGNYYISLTYNEMILASKKVLMHKIKNEDYHSFYTPQRVNDYTKFLKSKKI